MSLILSGTDGLSDVDGSAATPAIRGTDANTGIFFPAADTIAFSRGGTEAMRINSSGQLDLVNNPVLSGGTANGIVYLNGSKALTSGSYLTFDGTNLGIGTSSPTVPLFVVGGSTTGFTPGIITQFTNSVNSGCIQIGSAPTGSGTVCGLRITGDTGGGTTYDTYRNVGGSPFHAFLVNATERMRIDSSGNVLVGATATPYASKFAVFGAKGFTAGLPTNQLQVFDTTTAAADVGGAVSFGGLYSGALYTGWASIAGNKENGTDGNFAGYLRFATRPNGGSDTERMRIDSSGNLLVGTTSASAGHLVKVTNTTNAGLLFTGANSVANDGTLSAAVANGSILMVSENITGDGALFFCGYKSATITLLSDPNNRYATSVTAGRICVTKSANSGTVTITNKIGATASITFSKVSTSD